MPAAAARQALGLDPKQKVLAILGGSQGASALNAWARGRLEALASEGIQVVCVTGLGKGAPETLATAARKTGEPVTAVFMPFCDRVAELLSAADLVVSRAGAGTLAELIRCEVPAILVPYPRAASDHQRANAAFFERQGGGLVVEEAALGGLHSEVLDLIFNDWLLRQFRGNLKRMDRANSLELMLADLEEMAAPGRRRAPRPDRRRPPHESLAAADALRPRRCAGSTASAWAAWASRRWRSTSRGRAGGCRARTTRSAREVVARCSPAAGGRGRARFPAECDLVVRSSADPRLAPVVRWPRPRAACRASGGASCWPRSLRDKKLVAVCGSHGKTTTTAMLVTALRRAGFPAGYVAGGLFNDSTPPAARGLQRMGRGRGRRERRHDRRVLARRSR